MCINALFSPSTILSMHDSMARLLFYTRQASQNWQKPVKTFGDIAAVMVESSATLTNWKSRGISKDGAIKAERIFGCSVNWLMTGEGDPDGSGGSDPRPGKPGARLSVVPKGAPDVLIPQFNTGGAMGKGLILRDQPGVIQSWRVSPEWIQKNVRSFSATQNLCIVTGFGDSMKPMFNPGDPLLVDIGVREVEYDAIYFFRVGEEGFIKRLQRIPGEGLRVLSANRDNYESWTVKSDMDFEVFGRVLKVWRSEDF
jgi:hypothetical protein